MKVNSRSVRIQASKIEVEKDLLIGSEVSLNVTGDVVKMETIDNMDSTVDLVYIIKGFIVEVIK